MRSLASSTLGTGASMNRLPVRQLVQWPESGHRMLAPPDSGVTLTRARIDRQTTFEIQLQTGEMQLYLLIFRNPGSLASAPRVECIRYDTMCGMQAHLRRLVEESVSH